MRTQQRARDGRMSLREHLLEARNRLFLAGLGILVGTVVGWFLYEPVFELLQQPILDVAAEKGRTVALNFAGVASAIDMQVKIAVWLGLIVSSPWWLYQVWAFVVPGLTRREKLYTLGFLGSAVPLFLAGACLAWWVLPRAVVLLVEFVPDQALNIQDAQAYLSFVAQIILAFGLVFLLPVFMVAFNMVGIVRARTYLRGWRWAVVLACVFSAVMTPTPDVVTMLAMTLPIIVLYFAAVGVAALHDRRRDRRRAAQEQEDGL